MFVGLDLQLRPYNCVATGDEIGMLEVVLDSETTSHISKVPFFLSSHTHLTCIHTSTQTQTHIGTHFFCFTASHDFRPPTPWLLLSVLSSL